MKSKIPPFEELINRLVVCIQNDNPDRIIGGTEKSLLSMKWKGKDRDLFKMVKVFEIREFKRKNELTNIRPEQEYREISFNIGCDILGNPITCIHKVLFKNEYLSNNKKSSNYRKLKDPNKYFWQQEIVKQW